MCIILLSVLLRENGWKYFIQVIRLWKNQLTLHFFFTILSKPLKPIHNEQTSLTSTSDANTNWVLSSCRTEVSIGHRSFSHQCTYICFMCLFFRKLPTFPSSRVTPVRLWQRTDEVDAPLTLNTSPPLLLLVGLRRTVSCKLEFTLG